MNILATPAYPSEGWQPAKKMHERFAPEIYQDPSILEELDPQDGHILPTSSTDMQVWCRAMDYERIEVWDQNGVLVEGAGFYVRNCVEE